ncbi:MAG: outer membrane beta-barrel protein [Bacteroidota bacterium]
MRPALLVLASLTVVACVAPPHAHAQPVRAPTLLDCLDGLPLYVGVEVGYVQAGTTPASSGIIRGPLPTVGFALNTTLGWEFVRGVSVLARPGSSILYSDATTKPIFSVDLGMRFQLRQYALGPYAEVGYTAASIDDRRGRSDGLNLAGGLAYALTPKARLVLDVRYSQLETEPPPSLFAEPGGYKHLVRVSVGIVGFGRE